MKTEPIQDYILKNERNLQIAAAVGDAWPKARERLVSDFLNRLDARLKRKLKGWESGPYGGQFFLDANPGYYFWKPGWQHHSIGLQCNDYGRIMVMGMSRGTDDTRKLPLEPRLLKAMQKIHPSAKSQAWWDARVNMYSPSADWSTPEILWRMQADPKFLADVAEQLLALAKVSEPIVDRLGRRK